MIVKLVSGGFYLASQNIKDGAGNVVRVEAACLPDRVEAIKQCYKQCVEGGQI